MRLLPYLISAFVSIWAADRAAAQTIGYADAVDRLARACGADIQKFCKGVNLGGGRIRSCLAQNQDKVSAQCRVTYAEVYVLLEKRAAAQVAVVKICEPDARRLCGGVQMGDGNLLDCLLEAQRTVSPRCNQAITDAGYR